MNFTRITAMDLFDDLVKLKRFEPITCRIPPTTQLVRDFEKRFKISLSSDYKEFLARHGGLWGPAIFPVEEPSPCGNKGWLESLYGFMQVERKSDDIRWRTETFGGAPVIAPIGQSDFGSMVCIMCTGKSAGEIYLFDGEQRSSWPDAQFSAMFQALAPEIQEYLRLRKEGALPRKPPGYEDFYRVSANFIDFFNSCERPEGYD